MLLKIIHIKHYILTSVICLLFSHFISAQQTDTTSAFGILKGKAKDSVYNFMLTSATVAVYKNTDSVLVQFTLPNNFGEFTVDKLPLNLPLRLILTHVGYKDFIKKFTLKPEQKILDMGLLYLYQNDRDSSGNYLEEIIVKSIPPMRMNGDTIEFNADAFRMDKNATTEDLMRRLPGFTIWSDGEITYNGKKINAVYVEGKPFMGTNNISVATQNLPKEALDKIQVYQQRDEKNPLDSTLFANIKLKADKKMGYFGKLSAGLGTSPPGAGTKSSNKYALDGMLSGFNKKLQLSTVGAWNNINKLANGVDMLMKNSTFKNEGINTDYQSDFSLSGINKPVTGGIKVQYDFIEAPLYNKRSWLIADYFINRNNNFIQNNSIINSFLQADTTLTSHSSGTNKIIANSQNFNTKYENNKRSGSLSIFANAAINNTDNISNSKEEQSKTGLGNISSGTALSQLKNNQKNLETGFDYRLEEEWYNPDKSRLPRAFSIGYKLKYNTQKSNGKKKTEFKDLLNPLANKLFDRLYANDDAEQNTHSLNFEYPNFRELLLNKHTLGGINIRLGTNATFSQYQKNNKVLDFDSIAHQYHTNAQLTYNYHTNISDITPVVTLNKTFYKGLTNRYNKYVAINIKLQNQFYTLDNSGSIAVQNFSYRYSKFTPQAYISYYNHQYGSYETSYNLAFRTGASYPSVLQIAPITDSTNFWLIPKGNPLLLPQFKKELSFTYNFTTRTPKNPFILDASISAGKWDKYISDSSWYGNTGVRTLYPVNINDNRYLTGTIHPKKSIELKRKNTIELDATYLFRLSRNPQYINAVLNIDNSILHNPEFNFLYRHKDIAALKLEKGWFVYNSKQKGFNDNQLKSITNYIRWIAAIQLPKNLYWNTNITYNKNTSNNTSSIYYTIWNAAVSYRFLKGNSGEIKFEALDLLRQNKGIINTSTTNTQIFTTSNVLQNYFMLTLSFYPRKFGNN